MGEFCLHHVKFFNYVPSGIKSLAFNQADSLLAVGRDDNSLEIWKAGEEKQWHQEKVIPGSQKHKVNCLVWVKGRLFSAGLLSHMIEYDLQKLEPKKSVYFGNAFLCLAANYAETHIAAGCEDGYIRLYEVNDEGFTYDRAFQMQQGRVASLAWHPSDDVIVTGSLDNIRLWNVSTGHAKLRITMQRVQRNQEVVVWQVAILEDMTVVSGDSVGRTQFWNGTHGTLLKSYTSHRAAILSMCVSADKTSVFTAGIDPIIAEFRLVAKTSGSDSKHWVRSRTMRDHTHDVRALVMARDQLVSGGLDTQLAVNPAHLEVDMSKLKQSAHKHRQRIRGFPHRPLVSLAVKARLLLLQFPFRLEVWKLGNTQESSDEDGKVLPLSEHPVKLLEVKSKSTEQIVCSSISSCGLWLAYSDVEKLRFYHITRSPLAIERVPTIPHSVQPAHHLAFTPDSSKLIMATKSGGLQVLTVEGPDGVDCPQPLLQTIPTGDLQGPILNLTVSGDGLSMGVVDGAGRVVVFRNRDRKTKRVDLPQGKGRPCCLAFHRSGDQIAVAYSNRHIAEYDIVRQEYTPWSRQCHKKGLHHAWLDKANIIQQLTYDPTNSEHLLLHDGLSLTVIDKTKPLPSNAERLFHQRLGKRGHDRTVQSEKRSHGFAICSKFKTIMFIGMLEDPGNLVLVERPQQAILEQLPAAFPVKKFGT